ncbi:MULTISPECIES: hypothetical protein [Thalassospira]|uniref:Uncharacterized protein n=2 Tax=Thalassospira TaxID=168934 RepID=A0A367VYT4_9PROT|nr:MULTISPECIES: hypothetical protein [Thalassospira]MDG4721759.1 hypothetical protein [Thalassospira sp. FZY0004]RCK31302.1 hypothetical protein TH19_21325 [Thalassospira profundimaris]
MGGFGEGLDDPADDDEKEEDDGKKELPWYNMLDRRFIGDGSDYKEHFDYPVPKPDPDDEQGEEPEDET